MKDERTTTPGFTQVENGELAQLRSAARKNNLLTELRLEKALAEQIYREIVNNLDAPIYAIYKTNTKKAATDAARRYLADPAAAQRLIDAEYGGDRLAYFLECCRDAAGYQPWDGRWNDPESARRRAPAIGRARPRRPTMMPDVVTMH